MTRITLLVALMTLLGACSSSDTRSSGMTDHFQARHEISIEIPEGARSLRAWLAVPSDSDPHQRVGALEVDCPYPTRTVRDERGNNFLLVEASTPRPGKLVVTTSFDIQREEVIMPVDPAATRPHTNAELAAFSADLASSSQSVITPEIKALAERAVGNETNPIRVARLLYDAVLEHVDYHVKDPKPNAMKTMKSSGTGSSEHTYRECTGNCTDFHSLYAAMARSRRIPTRAVYGSFFKGPLDGEDKDQSYHCWIEFHAPGVGWIPLDVAVADVFTSDFVANEHSRPRAHLTVADGYHGPDAKLVDYYFGNLDARRVVWHRGRDLIMKNPRQSSAPLLWNPKAHVEIDGKAAKVGRKLTYRSK